MRSYKTLNETVFTEGNYSLVPIREEDKYLIMQWRNEQIFHLRQAEPMTKEKQESYFRNVVDTLFEQEKPSQLLFSYLENGICIGYGGLVHINWMDKNAEISFIINTALEKENFEFHWQKYLSLIEKVAFADLKFHKIFTYAFDLRPHLYKAIEGVGFTKEATLKEHCFFEGKFIDVIIHSKVNTTIFNRKANELDLDLFFKWANDEATRQNSFSIEIIDYQQHTTWFNKKIKDKNCQLLVFENEINQPIGQVRIEKKEAENVIGISIDENFRGKGYASKMIQDACQLFFKNFTEKEVTAYIKKTNISSTKSFERAGFKIITEKEVNLIPSLVLNYTC